MHVSVAAFLLVPLAAYARPQVPITWPQRYCPQTDEVTDVTGKPWQLGVSSKGGATLQITQSHEVGTTWTIGLELGIGVDQIIGVDAALASSVAETITDGTAEGVEKECPEGRWSCSMLVFPGMKLVKGHLELMQGGTTTCPVSVSNAPGNYELEIPRMSDAGNPKSSVDICTCPNLEGADDEGHPELMCIEDCVDPDGK